MVESTCYFRIYAEEDGLSSSLFIKDIRESDDGYYSCQAGGGQAVVQLKVIGISSDSSF